MTFAQYRNKREAEKRLIRLRKEYPKETHFLKGNTIYSSKIKTNRKSNLRRKSDFSLFRDLP